MNNPCSLLLFSSGTRSWHWYGQCCNYSAKLRTMRDNSRGRCPSRIEIFEKRFNYVFYTWHYISRYSSNTILGANIVSRPDNLIDTSFLAYCTWLYISSQYRKSRWAGNLVSRADNLLDTIFSKFRSVFMNGCWKLCGPCRNRSAKVRTKHGESRGSCSSWIEMFEKECPWVFMHVTLY